MSFNDKTIWITGASSGIGEALALEIARTAAGNTPPRLILSARRKEALEAVAKACEDLGASCWVYPLDVSDQAMVESVAQTVQQERGSIDYLFNNAGISQRSLARETSLEVDRKIMEVNYFGAIALTKAILEGMIEKGGGHIINISSVVGKFGFPLRTAYAASKHAMHGFFESLRAESWQENIRVLVVCPGRIRTNISFNALTKDGSKHGVMDDGQAAGIAPDKCARIILRGIRRNKKELYIGRKESLLIYIRRYLPALYYRMVKKLKPT